MFAKFSGVISTIASIIGTIAFFCHSFPLLCICAVISIINSFIQVICGDQNNLVTEIATVIVFSIIAFFTKSTWFIMIAFGLCLVDALMSIIGWIMLALMSKKF